LTDGVCRDAPRIHRTNRPLEPQDHPPGHSAEPLLGNRPGTPRWRRRPIPRFDDEGTPDTMNPGRVVGHPLRRMGLPRPVGASQSSQRGQGPKGGDDAAEGAVGKQTNDPGIGGHGDTEFEKEAWLNRVTVDWGLCGFSIGEALDRAVAATVLFAPPRFAPTAS